MKATHSAQIIDLQSSISTVAILQLTRFGDLIQTAQAVEELRKNHPEYRVILIGRAQFAKPLEFILKTMFDKIYYLDTKKIFDHSEIEGARGSLNNLNFFLSDISSENIEVLINLSFNPVFAISIIFSSNIAFFMVCNKLCRLASSI